MAFAACDSCCGGVRRDAGHASVRSPFVYCIAMGAHRCRDMWHLRTLMPHHQQIAHTIIQQIPARAIQPKKTQGSETALTHTSVPYVVGTSFNPGQVAGLQGRASGAGDAGEPAGNQAMQVAPPHVPLFSAKGATSARAGLGEELANVSRARTRGGFPPCRRGRRRVSGGGESGCGYSGLRTHTAENVMMA